MKRVYLIGLFLFLMVGVSAISETKIDYFYSSGCPHCLNVLNSGVLENVSNIGNVSLEKYNIYESAEGKELFNFYMQGFDIPSNQRGVPFVVINQGDFYSYSKGDVPIINSLEDKVVNFEGFLLKGSQEKDSNSVTFWSVIIAGIIDSVNPCAFGVLIFLMASLLKMGSSKRALRAGLIYSFVVFVVYFSIGLILYKVIDLFSATPYFYYFYISVAAMIFLLGIVQLKDVFFYGKGFTLKISSKVKPLIENFMSKGTLVSIIILGILVSLFELPCTGEIYIGILTLMSVHNAFGYLYLVIYNIIFVLPLIILTYLIYKGTSTEKLQGWTVSNRKYMKLVSGLLLIGLATYIFIRSLEFM